MGNKLIYLTPQDNKLTLFCSLTIDGAGSEVDELHEEQELTKTQEHL